MMILDFNLIPNDLNVVMTFIKWLELLIGFMILLNWIYSQ